MIVGVAIRVWQYLRTINKKGPVGPTFIIDLKFDILDFSTEAIKYVFTSLCLLNL